MINESQEMTEEERAARLSNEVGKDPADPSYSRIDDSFFVHAKPQENDPVMMKSKSDYTNTIYENLFGSHITVTKLKNRETGQEKILSKHKQKMGIIALDIQNGRLNDDWEEANRNEVQDYKAGQSEVCINENWVKDPPNILVFSLNRVKYDKET